MLISRYVVPVLAVQTGGSHSPPRSPSSTKMLFTLHVPHAPCLFAIYFPSLFCYSQSGEARIRSHLSLDLKH
jgi:hypothetical protein